MSHSSPYEKLVVVYSFPQPHQATLYKTKLQSEGIDAFLRDEFAVQTLHYHSNALGGVKLMVREKDVSKAVNLLKQAGLRFDFKPDQSNESLLKWIEQKTRWGILIDYNIEKRLVILLALLFGLITAIVLLINLIFASF